MEGSPSIFAIWCILQKKMLTFGTKYSQLNSNLYEKLMHTLNLYDYDI